MSTDNRFVAIRKVSIPLANMGNVAGFCLSYTTKDDALSFFDFIHTYLSATGELPRQVIDISTSHTLGNVYILKIIFGLSDWTRLLEIEQIPSDYVDNIRQSLKVFPYYLIIAGYEGKDGFTLLPISQYHLFLNSIRIDKKNYTGVKNQEFPWQDLIQSEYMVHVSDE